MVMGKKEVYAHLCIRRWQKAKKMKVKTMCHMQNKNIPQCVTDSSTKREYACANNGRISH